MKVSPGYPVEGHLEVVYDVTVVGIISQSLNSSPN